MPYRTTSACAALTLWAAACAVPAESQAQTQTPFVFEDVTARAGLARYLEQSPGHKPWRYAHGAGWGDVDGDGRPDLYIGAFAARQWYEGDDAPIPNMLFLNRPEGFARVEDETLEFLDRNARCSGVLFADLDNDADLDLVVSNHVTRPDHEGSRLFENIGDGRFRDATPTGRGWPARLGARNVSVIDFNVDGLLDLVMADGSYGREKMAAAKLIALENQGRFRFEDVSERLGFPQSQTHGLGLAVGDVNQDHVPDFFVAGSNRLFVSDGPGEYREAHPGRFAIPTADVREGKHCGAAFGDINGDDLLDLVTTEHGVPTRIHVFANRGVRDGAPDLVEVSDSAGVGDLFPEGTRESPIKTSHVALEDMDHDGKPDVVLAVLYEHGRAGVQPVVLRNLSSRGGDIQLSKPPYDQMTGYHGLAALSDYDRDGRLDIFLPVWFEDRPNRLFRNTTDVGHWLCVRVRGEGGDHNTMGIGAVVRLYESGHSGEPDHQLGRRDIVVGTGYAGSGEPLAHFGLASTTRCDVEVTWRDRTVRKANVPADQALTVAVGPRSAER